MQNGSEIESNKFVASFENLGLKPQEAKVYFALLKLGQARVGEICVESEIQRTYVYDILRDLQERGIVSAVEIKGRKRFNAVSIEQFRKIQLAKISRFEELMPELQSLVTTTGDRPKVQLFEGKEGFVIAQNDTLNMVRGSEIMAYSTGEGLYEDDPKMAFRYIKERMRKRIRVRSIAPDNEATRKFARENKKHLRETRLVPEDKFAFSNEINIYGDKLSILSLTGELIAVIIESESVARTQKMIFELAWLGAEQIV